MSALQGVIASAAKQSRIVARLDCFRLRVSRATADKSAPTRLAMTALDYELLPRDPPVGLQITLAGGVDDMCGQKWRRGVAIPAAGAALGVEIVAQRLLVKTRLRPAGLVGIDGPEARRIRRHHLVDQDDLSVAVAAEFEFGVGDDDALLAGEAFAAGIDRARQTLQLVGDGAADHLAHPPNRDVLVMAGLGLGRRAED